MAIGYLSPRGVYHFGEDDVEATVSQLLNRLSQSIEDLLTPETVDWWTVAENVTGWNIESGTLTKMGPHRHLLLSIKRTGAAITVPTNGDFANTTIGKIITPADRPSFEAPGSTWGSGRVVAATLGASGNINLTSCAPGSNIATNEIISIGIDWFVGGGI